MKSKSYKKNTGFTLIEMLTVMIIIIIMMSYAVPAYRDFAIRQNLSNTTNDLLSDLTFARVTAVKLGHLVVIESISGADWSDGWRIFEVMDGDFVYTDGVDRLIREETEVPFQLSLSGPTSVGFDVFGAKSRLAAANAVVENITVSHSDISETKVLTIALSGLVN